MTTLRNRLLRLKSVSGHRIMQVLVAIDQLANVIIGLFIGNSWSDETWSARSYRNREKSLVWTANYKVINSIFFWVSNHCKSAYLSEKRRLQSPPEERCNDA
jgi:hypothetical protein